MPMSTIVQNLTENPLPEGLPVDTNDLTTISRSCETYSQLLTNVKSVEKIIAVGNLNERGFAKITYQVVDRVTFFLHPLKSKHRT